MIAPLERQVALGKTPGIVELHSAKPLGSPSCTRQNPWDRRVALGKTPGIAELHSASYLRLSAFSGIPSACIPRKLSPILIGIGFLIVIDGSRGVSIRFRFRYRYRAAEALFVRLQLTSFQRKGINGFAVNGDALKRDFRIFHREVEGQQPEKNCLRYRRTPLPALWDGYGDWSIWMSRTRTCHSHWDVQFYRHPSGACRRK